MHGGPSKPGRGGGGGRGNRSSFPPPQAPRPSPAAQTGRLSLGSAPRNRPSIGGSMAPALAPAVEESFSLVPGKNPLPFGMIIRLAPDLVEEIRRLEAQGGTARIKFDSIHTNPVGNVIDVGGKEFRFTWAPEVSHHDIYEEQRSGEDGNGLLVESGCAWRKLNVQRILDESITNQVKMRSEEAERKHKSRKAIVLDHGNPSMKNQIKQMAAAEASPWKSHFKKKESAFKKKKETPPATIGGPLKSGYKSGLSSAANVKGRHSTSPLPSPPERSGPAASPVGVGNISKNQASIDDIMPPLKSKENASSFDKETPTKPTNAVREMPGRRGNFGAKPMDLQSLLFTLLKENPKGMSLKALEKAVGDSIANSARKIEPILKKMATFQAPGRYFLKPGLELESLKKPSSESGSSPEENHQRTPALEENHDRTAAPVPNMVEKVMPGEIEEQTHLDSKLGVESNVLEQLDIQQNPPELGGEQKASDNSEGKANSASDSGSDSDSDSDSSDSGSDSGSHSRSGSGSSSDSESDASSNSKEGSDVDVDIMTSDDEKEIKQTLQTSEPELVSSPRQWQTGNGRPLQNGMDENLDGDEVDIEGNGSDAVDIEGHGSDAVNIEKDLIEDEQDIGMDFNSTKEGKKPEEGAKPSSSDHDEPQDRQNFIGNLFDDTENIIKDSVRHEQNENSERLPKAKSKRGSDQKHFDDRPERTKRLKSESLSQPPFTGSRDPSFSGGIRNLSPCRPIDDAYQDSSGQMMNKGDREEHADFGSQKGYNQVFPRKSTSDFHQSGRRPSDQSARVKANDTAERPTKYTESSGHGRKSSDKNVHDDYIQKDNPPRNIQNEDGLTKDKKLLRNLKEGAGGKNVVPADLHHRKHGEPVGKPRDTGQISSSYINSSPKDNNRNAADRYPVNGKGNVLLRELSHLELGEIREPLVEETPMKKQFERKNSFKQSVGRPSTSENFNSDLNRGKPAGKTKWDSGKPSSPSLSGLKKSPEHYAEDLPRSHHRVVQSQQQHLSRVDHPEVGSQFNKLADTSGKTRQNETGAKQEVGPEDYGESHKKAPAGAPLQQESKRGFVSHYTKESKMLTSNKLADVTDVHKDTAFSEGNVNGRRKRASSSDEDVCPYSKYEKDDPEKKGPIKDSSQFEEYMNEFREKYESYNDLDKTLQTYRNDFEKLGKELEYLKDRDMDNYYKTRDQMVESYHQCGMRHKRLKKIFVVLHYELKNLKQRLIEYARSVD